jgi:hypothetical protein
MIKCKGLESDHGLFQVIILACLKGWGGSQDSWCLGHIPHEQKTMLTMLLLSHTQREEIPSLPLFFKQKN